MPSNTSRGFPYPLSSEPLSAIATAIQNLAVAVNTRVGAVASGVANVPVTSSAIGTLNITFPAGRFTAPPVVTACAQNSVYNGMVNAVTATGCTVAARRLDGGSATLTVPVSWIAVQQ